MNAPLRPGNPLRLYDPLAAAPREVASSRLDCRVLSDASCVLNLAQGVCRIVLRMDRAVAEAMRDFLLQRHRGALRGTVATLGDPDGFDIVAHMADGAVWLEASDGTVVTLDEAAILQLSRICREVIDRRIIRRVVA